jgi:kynurenine 3-monooxygenase
MEGIHRRLVWTTILLVVPSMCSSFVGPVLLFPTISTISRPSASCSSSPYASSIASRRTTSTQLDAANKKKLHIAVVGGGPSGLLLTHLLLLPNENDPANPQKESNMNDISVTLLEGREDPRKKGSSSIEQRAYALGLGIRGRTAIRQVDEGLWQTVKERGFESQRFQLHIAGLVIPLRSEKDNADETLEPSLIIYQSELCAGLTNELERRHGTSGRLRMKHGTRVTRCDLNDMKITTENGEVVTEERYDLILGCDGVNSVVRAAMQDSFPAFQSTKEKLPGEFKVVRLEKVPPGVDPTSVSLILPKKGSVGAFVEPTGKDGSCCILFSGRGETPILRETKNATAVEEVLAAAFPQWEGFHKGIANELMRQSTTGTASSVVCNIYNFGDKAALAGDACHATGGVSGQGVNSALADSVVLAKCILENRIDLAAGLLEYSCHQVPEGRALYDLSFGPKPKGIQGLVWAARSARDTLFRGRFGIGRPPLQTRLTTDLTAFLDIRREIDKYYDDPFPSNSELRRTLTSIHESALKATVTK